MVLARGRPYRTAISTSSSGLYDSNRSLRLNRPAKPGLTVRNSSTSFSYPAPMKQKSNRCTSSATSNWFTASIPMIGRLPPRTSNEYETYIHSVIAQCVKAEMLAANSWRVAVNAGAQADGPLLGHLAALEETRVHLLSLLPDSLSSR